MSFIFKRFQCRIYIKKYIKHKIYTIKINLTVEVIKLLRKFKRDIMSLSNEKAFKYNYKYKMYINF